MEWLSTAAAASAAVVAIAGWLAEKSKTRTAEHQAKAVEHQAEAQTEGVAAGLVQQLAERITTLEQRVAQLQEDNERLRARLTKAHLRQRETDRHLRDTNTTLVRVMSERDGLRERCERLETRLEQLERNENHEL